MNPRYLMAIMLIGFVHIAVADVTQFRGENGAGLFEGEGLMTSWPEGGPPLAWKADGLGVGYASPVQSEGKIYVPGMTPDEMGHVFILSSDGVPLGRITYGKETQDGQAPGSRSTPAIDGTRLYLLSGLGTV